MSSEAVTTGSGLDGQVSTERDEIMVSVDAPTTTVPSSTATSPQFDYPLSGAWKRDVLEMLTRPQLIVDDIWLSGGGGLSSIDLYDSLVSQTIIAYKITNAYKFRPKGYKITVRANGNPYLYGMLWIAAIPDFTTAFLSQTAAKTTLTSFSCFPNLMMIDASGDTTCEIIAPHVFNRELVLPAQVLGVMGLYFFEAATLATTNSTGPTPAVDINIFASFVDPVLMEYTSNHAYYATMKKVKGAQPTEAEGALSKPLNAISRGMREMKDVPLIGAFANSFSQAAAFGGKVASWFGFSAPPMNLNYVPTIARTGGQLAIAEGMDMGEQLSIHREVSTIIDPALLGIDREDYMNLLSLARRWSCASTFSWPDTTPGNTALGSIQITPLMGTIVGSSLAPTWLRFVTQPFQYFRGSIELRIIIPASKFHVGRIQFVFDPYGAPGSNLSTTTRNWIIDLSDTTMVEFAIPFPYYYPAYQPWSNNDFWIANPSHSYGQLTIIALSQLRSGLSASTLTGLVFVRAGPDAEWYQPTLMNSTQATDNTHLNVTGRFPTATTTTPTQTGYQWFGTSEELLQPLSMVEQTTPAYMSQFIWSDRVVSIRELIKRFSYNYTITTASTTGTASYNGVRDVTSQPYIATNNASQSTISGDQFQQFNYFTYFMPAFLYYRGGMRHKFYGPVANLSVFKDVSNTTREYVYGNPATNRYKYFMTAASNLGMARAGGANQGVLEVLNPWNDYVFARRNDAAINDYDSSSGVILLSAAQAPVLVDHYVAAGDDMTFFQPICPPIQYKFNVSF